MVVSIIGRELNLLDLILAGRLMSLYPRPTLEDFH